MNMEQNKILAALLVAGIIASLSGFIGHKITEPVKLKEPVYKIEGVASAEGGAVQEQATAEPIKDLMAKADAAEGEKVSKLCAACHTFGKGEPNRVGPNLAGIIGKSHAHMADFAYSDAMKASKGTWSETELNEFLWSPRKHIPGTKMTFAGLKKPEDRANLIKWLKTK